MKLNDLPSRWKQSLKEHIKRQFDEDRDHLLASDFRFSLKMSFPDGSFVFFHDAFYIVDSETNEVAIFTEHCGYHIFPFIDSTINLLEPKWSDVGTD